MNHIKCEKCQNVPEKFVCLDCEHSFCLSCLAKFFKQHENQIQCITCLEITILDDETINALMEFKLQSIQPPVIIPYTTSKKQNNQKDQIQIKGHPFIEKLNVSIEKCLDNIRFIQFDRQKIREISNSIKQDLESEFKSLHLYLEDRLEAYMNEIQRFETMNSTNLQKQEDEFQIDIQEMQIMKDEIKSLLYSFFTKDLQRSYQRNNSSNNKLNYQKNERQNLYGEKLNGIVRIEVSQKISDFIASKTFF